MKRYERILVCIDQSKYDEPLLEYARDRSRVAGSKEIHVLCVVDDSEEGSSDTEDGTPDSQTLTDEALRDLVSKHFNGTGQEQLCCRVVRGSALVEILRYAHEKSIDLIMLSRHLGRQVDEDDEALLARRITRKGTCSVLVLPEEYQLRADDIIVPVRDSECSANALEVACGVARVTGASVTALNVYAVHAGYKRTGKTLEEHQGLLETAASQECSQLLEKTETHNIDVECRCLPNLHGKTLSIILEVLGSGSGKAVVIGARGRSGAAGVLLGTVTEELIRYSPSPVLAVKKKGECVGLLRALQIIVGED